MKERQVKTTGCTQQTNNNPIADAYFKEQVKNPGMIFCLNRQDDWNETEVFIRKVMKDFPGLHVLVYYAGGKMEPKPVATHLLVTDNSDFNLFGKQKPLLKEWLNKHSFDLLLVFARKENKRCNTLVTSVRARLKAGMVVSTKNLPVDISLGKPGEKMSYDLFYSELKKYLKQLNITLLS